MSFLTGYQRVAIDCEDNGFLKIPNELTATKKLLHLTWDLAPVNSYARVSGCLVGQWGRNGSAAAIVKSTAGRCFWYCRSRVERSNFLQRPFLVPLSKFSQTLCQRLSVFLLWAAGFLRNALERIWWQRFLASPDLWLQLQFVEGFTSTTFRGLFNIHLPT